VKSLSDSSKGSNKAWILSSDLYLQVVSISTKKFSSFFCVPVSVNTHRCVHAGPYCPEDIRGNWKRMKRFIPARQKDVQAGRKALASLPARLCFSGESCTICHSSHHKITDIITPGQPKKLPSQCLLFEGLFSCRASLQQKSNLLGQVRTPPCDSQVCCCG